MGSSNAERDPVEVLADEFLQRRRGGENPSIREYTQKYPELAVEIRDVFPALEVMADVCPGTEDFAPSKVDTVVDTPAPMPRTVGDYRILREIGRGAMGVVYEAEQQSLGRRVALKVLPKGVGADRRALLRFRTEARAAAQLHHTNIVPVFEVGQDGDIVFYAMQYIEGQSLDQVIDDLRRLRDDRPTVGPCRPESVAVHSAAVSVCRGEFFSQSHEAEAPETGSDNDGTDEPEKVSAMSGPQSSAERAVYVRSIAQLGEQVASARSYAHERGIIHRDIKPSNLLLDANGIVWVADFGLAKTEDDAHTRMGGIVGTLRYMAPERFQGVCNAQSDVYSLGITLCELRAVSFSPDGRYLACGCRSNTVVVLDLASGGDFASSEPYLEAHGPGPVSSLAFTPDQQALAVQAARVVLLIHVETGHTLGRISLGDLLGFVARRRVRTRTDCDAVTCFAHEEIGKATR